MTHWYTADLHLCDAGALRFFARPFRSITEMNHAIIDGLAARLKHDDDLWVLGDVADADHGGAAIATTLLNQLPGENTLFGAITMMPASPACPGPASMTLSRFRTGLAASSSAITRC